MSDPFMDAGFLPFRPHFEYEVGSGLPRVAFDWDRAAIGPGTELLIVEEELARPVVLHIQGHVSRATFMVARGEKIRKLVWIVREQDFQALWRIAEPWRAALLESSEVEPPACEYWTPDGQCLAISPKLKALGPIQKANSGRNDLDADTEADG